jgi:hypothetical protein
MQDRALYARLLGIEGSGNGLGASGSMKRRSVSVRSTSPHDRDIRGNIRAGFVDIRQQGIAENGPIDHVLYTLLRCSCVELACMPNRTEDCTQLFCPFLQGVVGQSSEPT